MGKIKTSRLIWCILGNDGARYALGSTMLTPIRENADEAPLQCSLQSIEFRRDGTVSLYKPNHDESHYLVTYSVVGHPELSFMILIPAAQVSKVFFIEERIEEEVPVPRRPE